MTNFEIVKSKMKLEDMPKDEHGRNIFCKTIHDIRKEKNCNRRNCIECKQWLEADEGILDETERKYLSIIISPYRVKVVGIAKKCSYIHKKIYCIHIIVNERHKKVQYALPGFTNNKMYKGMQIDKIYSPNELGI